MAASQVGKFPSGPQFRRPTTVPVVAAATLRCYRAGRALRFPAAEIERVESESEGQAAALANPTSSAAVATSSCAAATRRG
jgi:hypothetical protein